MKRILKEGNIGLKEAIALTTLVIASKILYTSPSAVINSTGTAGWYTTIISFLISLFFFFILSLLMDRFPGKNLIEIFEVVFGKIIGKFFNLLFCCYVIYYSSMGVREFLEMIKSYNLPRTPPSVILTSFLVVSLIIAYKGLEVIAKISYVVFYPILIILALILILTFPYYNIDYLKPFWGYGLKTTFPIGFLRSSAYEEFLTVFMITKSIKSTKDVKTAGFISLSLAVLIFSISLLVYTIVFGYAQASEPLSGMFELSKIIYFNRYFQRVESFFIFIWVIASLITVSLSFYISIFIYCKTFNIKNHKPILFPFAFLMYMIALIPKNISELTEINLLFIRQYSMIMIYGIPLLAFLVAIIFKKKDKLPS